MTAKKCIVNDIDGEAWHTTDSGPIDEVRGRAHARLRTLIDAAEQSGRAQETWIDDDGEEYTACVYVSDVDAT